MLCSELLKNFEFPDQCDIDLVKDWIFKKCALIFTTWKKHLNQKYVKPGIKSNFTKELENLAPHWDLFVQYKNSDRGQ